jgi:CDP-glycerol glycerophosphotransferase (TagB/SpsB family)
MSVQHLIFLIFQPVWHIIDFITPKKSNYWAFSTHHIKTTNFIENQRAIFEHVKENDKLRKIIFYRGDLPDFEVTNATNTTIVKYGTFYSLILLAQCKVVFVTHSLSMDFSFRWHFKKFSILKIQMHNRLVINLWHGMPMKKLLYASNENTRNHTDRVPYRRFERYHYKGFITSSDIDSYAMAAMFYPINYQQIWKTGLPRNDFLLMNENSLPEYIQSSVVKINNLCKDKKLIFYAPTYRQTSISAKAHYYQFNKEEINELKAILKKNNAILGYRPHYFKNSEKFFNLQEYIDNETIVDLSYEIIPEISAIMRQCDVLITDYSSVCFDAIYLNKPTICFAYDLEQYQSDQDGLLYDLSLIFTTAPFQDFRKMLIKLDELLNTLPADASESMNMTKKIFFNYNDARNSERVINKIFKVLNL